ncbi:MAG: nucleotidyltransferase domain-containing protein [Gemmatimonadota bacterium]
MSASLPPLSSLLDSLRRAVQPHETIAAAYLYGSAARQRTTPLSDVDVALLFAADAESRARDLQTSGVAGEMARLHPGLVFDVRDVEELPLVVRLAEVDDARVHRFLREDLGDLDDFAASILRAFPDLGAGESP